MTIRPSSLPSDQAAFYEQISQQLASNTLSVDDRRQLETAVQALAPDELVSLSTLEGLRLRKDLEPHLVKMTLAAQYGADVAAVLTSGRGLAEGIASIAKSANVPASDLEAALDAFYTELRGPGLPTGMEPGFHWPADMALTVVSKDEIQIRDALGAAPDTPYGQKLGFEGTLKNTAEGWTLHLDRVPSEHWDGPREIPLKDMPRETLLKLAQKAEFVSKPSLGNDPRAAGLVKDTDALVTEKNGALGFYAPRSIALSVDSRDAKPENVNRIGFRGVGLGFSDERTKGTLEKQASGEWILQLDKPQSIPDGPKSSFTLDELPTRTLLQMDRAIRDSDEVQHHGDISSASQGLLAIDGAVQTVLAQRRAAVNDKLRTHLSGQLVQRTAFDTLTRLANSLLGAMGLSDAAAQNRTTANARSASKACHAVMDEIKLASTPADQLKLIRTASEGLGKLEDVDLHALSPRLVDGLRFNVSTALTMLDTLKSPIRASQKHEALVVDFRDRAVALLEQIGDPNDRDLRDLLTKVSAPGWAASKLNFLKANTKVDNILDAATSAVNAATSNLSALQLTLRAKGVTSRDQRGLNRLNNQIWVQATDAIQDAASRLRSAEQKAVADKELDGDTVRELSDSLRKFSQLWRKLESLGATTSEDFRDAVQDGNFLTKASPHRWDAPVAH